MDTNITKYMQTLWKARKLNKMHANLKNNNVCKLYKMHANLIKWLHKLKVKSAKGQMVFIKNTDSDTVLKEASLEYGRDFRWLI